MCLFATELLVRFPVCLLTLTRTVERGDALGTSLQVRRGLLAAIAGSLHFSGIFTLYLMSG